MPTISAARTTTPTTPPAIAPLLVGFLPNTCGGESGAGCTVAVSWTQVTKFKLLVCVEFWRVVVVKRVVVVYPDVTVLEVTVNVCVMSRQVLSQIVSTVAVSVTVTISSSSVGVATADSVPCLVLPGLSGVVGVISGGTVSKV